MNQDQIIHDSISKAHKIALFGHLNPDGDCIGAMLGFGALLEKQNKEVSYFVPSKPSKMFDFLPSISKLQTEMVYDDYDLIVFLDFSISKRIDKFFLGHEDYFSRSNIVVIDHHMGNMLDGAIGIQDTNAISASEVVFELSHNRWPDLFDADIATYFYLGLTTDSGNFRFDEEHQTVRVLSNAIKLLELGANKQKIIEQVFRNKSFGSVKFIQVILSRMKMEGDFLYSRYYLSDMETNNVDDEEADYGLYLMSDIGGPKLIALFKETESKLRCSLRAKGGLDCTKIAAIFGGGGHFNASGFTQELDCDFDQKIQECVAQIQAKI